MNRDFQACKHQTNFWMHAVTSPERSVMMVAAPISYIDVLHHPPPHHTTTNKSRTISRQPPDFCAYNPKPNLVLATVVAGSPQHDFGDVHRRLECSGRCENAL